MIRARRALKILQMAVSAGLGQAAEVASRVTLVARDRGMSTRKRERGIRMIELRPCPRSCGVAGRAQGRKAG